MPREYTNKILEMIDDGLLSVDSILPNLLNYLSEDEVQGFYQSEIGDDDEEEEEENDFDDIVLTNIVWESDDLDDAPDLPKTVELSLISEMLTSGDEYDRTEIEDWLEDKFCMPAVSFDVETD